MSQSYVHNKSVVPGSPAYFTIYSREGSYLLPIRGLSACV